MIDPGRAPRPLTHLFIRYALVSLIPVLILAVVLAVTFRSEATDRGLAEGRSEARLIARTAIEPLLGNRPLTAGLSRNEAAQLESLSTTIVWEGDILRLRLRDLSGNVVFSDDESGFGAGLDDEAMQAAHGAVIARLTRLNADAADPTNQGTRAVEVYQPLVSADPARRIGILELYLPYGPISHDVSTGLLRLYLELGVGLFVLYLALGAVTISVSRGLQREAALNAFLAEHDVLTELPNRTHFHRRAKAAIENAVRHDERVAIAIVDLDRFKEINDTLGHQNGDLLLTELARRLRDNMRQGDMVARLGGDEFGLILCGTGHPGPALHRLRGVIEQEVEISGLPLSVQASIGYATAPDDGVDIDVLIQRADVAMYVAKAQHTGVTRYESSLDHYDAGTLNLVGELRRAIDDGQLVLHYQPQATLADGQTRTLEALVRWQHPFHGLLYPGSFLPLAEQTDVIDKLTPWVLRTALTEVRSLDPAVGELCVAVNVSARNLSKPSFAQDVISLLEELEMPPDRLIVEVTETALLSDPRSAARVLQRLTDAGVRISLDDFGRGQTSLRYLSALPIEELKIDRSFVMDMPDNQAHAAIVRSIIDLGHNLSLRVVGEGVETAYIRDQLHRCRCDVAQGFLFARPMPLDKVERWLQDAAARPVAS